VGGDVVHSAAGLQQFEIGAELTVPDAETGKMAARQMAQTAATRKNWLSMLLQNGARPSVHY
jgi:hypothetical protein